jgi:phosphate-selective porin
MQNAFVSLLYIPRVQLDVGQFKLPLGLEGLANSGALGTVECALFTSDRARGGSYGDVRELGAIARTTIASRVDMTVGVFNFMSENQNDLDERASIRVAARPIRGT